MVQTVDELLDHLMSRRSYIKHTDARIDITSLDAYVPPDLELVVVSSLSRGPKRENSRTSISVEMELSKPLT